MDAKRLESALAMPDANPPDLPLGDRAAIEEAAQRTAEQTALRKVRKSQDSSEAAEARRRTIVRRIALVGVLVVVAVMLVVWAMLSANREQLRGAPVQIPGTVKK